jgi:hypothetical protein
VFREEATPVPIKCRNCGWETDDKRVQFVKVSDEYVSRRQPCGGGCTSRPYFVPVNASTPWISHQDLTRRLTRYGSTSEEWARYYKGEGPKPKDSTLLPATPTNNSHYPF